MAVILFSQANRQDNIILFISESEKQSSHENKMKKKKKKKNSLSLSWENKCDFMQTQRRWQFHRNFYLLCCCCCCRCLPSQCLPTNALCIAVQLLLTSKRCELHSFVQKWTELYRLIHCGSHIETHSLIHHTVRTRAYIYRVYIKCDAKMWNGKARERTDTIVWNAWMLFEIE